MNDFSPEEMTDRSADAAPTVTFPCEEPYTGLRVYQAICNVIADLSRVGIAKDRKNVQQGYMFRGVDDVYSNLSPLLAKHKLVILPRVIDRQQSERSTKAGTVMFHTALTVEYDLVSAIDGSRHTIRVPGEAMDSGDKSVNKALSAAYKYACFKTFCIPTEGEPDADAVTPPETIDSVDATEVITRSGVPEDRVAAWLARSFGQKKIDITKLTRAQFTILVGRLPDFARAIAEESMREGRVESI